MENKTFFVEAIPDEGYGGKDFASDGTVAESAHDAATFGSKEDAVEFALKMGRTADAVYYTKAKSKVY